MKRASIAGFLATCAALLTTLPAHALGEKRLAFFDQAPAGAVTLAHGGRAAQLFVDPADYPGVIRAAGDLQADIGNVSNAKAALNKSAAASGVTGTPTFFVNGQRYEGGVSIETLAGAVSNAAKG